MTYLIIHTNNRILEAETLKIINRHLEEDIGSMEELYNTPDFYIVQPEDKPSITIEQCKKLQKDIMYIPFQHKNQFGIILNAQLMTTQAQNSLLKTLEEKNENTILILTTNNEKSVLETILSRCTRVYPQSNNLELDDEVETEFELAKEFLSKPVHEKIAYIETLMKEDKENEENRVEELIQNLTQMYKKNYESNLKNGKNGQQELNTLEMLKDIQFKMSKNVNKKIALEYMCFKLD